MAGVLAASIHQQTMTHGMQPFRKNSGIGVAESWGIGHARKD
jgi:hypothetical protein